MSDGTGSSSSSVKIIIGAVVIVALLAGGLAFAMYGPGIGGDNGVNVPDPFSEGEEPEAEMNFQKSESINGVSVNVEYTEEITTKYVEVNVEPVDGREGFEEPEELHREGMDKTLENLKHGDKISVIGVTEDGNRAEISSYTVQVDMNPRADFEIEQSAEGGVVTVTATMEQGNLDWVTAESPGTFTEQSGDSVDHNGDGDKADDINIVRKNLVITDLERGDDITFIASLHGKQTQVMTYTVR